MEVNCTFSRKVAGDKVKMLLSKLLTNVNFEIFHKKVTSTQNVSTYVLENSKKLQLSTFFGYDTF